MAFGKMGARGGFGSAGALGTVNTWLNSTERSKGAIVLDFVNDRAFAGAQVTNASLLSVTRSGTAYAEAKDGTLPSFSANTLRRTTRGLRVDAAKVQSVTSPLDASAWGNSGASIANLGTNGPFQRIELTATTNFGRRVFASGVSSLNGKDVAITVWYEPGTTNRMRLTIRNTTTSSEIDLEGPCNNGIGEDSTHTIGTVKKKVNRKLANGMQELSCVFNSSSTNTDSFEFGFGPNTQTGSGTVIALGAQIEINSSDGTSIIPSQTTRSADVLSLTGAAASMVALGGTVLALTEHKMVLSAAGALPDMTGHYIHRIAVFPVTLSQSEINQWRASCNGFPYLAGVNMAGGSFTPTPSWASNQVIDYYLGKGFNLFRLPFKWTSIQPTITGVLDSTVITEIDRMVARVTDAGGYAILDCHNYMRRGTDPNGTDIVGASGSGVLSSDLADLWAKLAGRYMSNSHVIFQIMNEPSNMDSDLNVSVQNDSIAAIRSTGAKNLILAAGNSYSGAYSWGGANDNCIKTTGIVDSGDNLAFSGHQYLDAAFSGSQDTCVVGAGTTKLGPLIYWCRKTGRRGIMDETNFASNSGCNTEINSLLTANSSGRDALLGWAYWDAGGAWPPTNNHRIDPDDFSAPVDKPQMSILTNYLS